ncbi:hypothetical protein GUITHDRAFT_117765 [Guillardia theta CCMP2712]|uniref:RRM domain-containing protein n=1 Tax=Guillardia theta (strain CCMP2712) TaxID=905079 RepID=L1IJW1_GUITC|nr:hypothetical protein GUITHDRAFT_117765 [Guillardia theta CCMP2712]EKX36095.1 hypothetical protein GUITHDRAFT_117765 [Guillardia theta CCMP2712]|eukprot:XP_005823075.1 hypothetical protein GUITHDRAFT_117765 [Guillardia theta CCMP2712]
MTIRIGYYCLLGLLVPLVIDISVCAGAFQAPASPLGARARSSLPSSCCSAKRLEEGREDPHRIFVGGTSYQDRASLLRAYFERAGSIRQVEQSSRGYAIISFEDEASWSRALSLPCDESLFKEIRPARPLSRKHTDDRKAETAEVEEGYDVALLVPYTHSHRVREMVSELLGSSLDHASIVPAYEERVKRVNFVLLRLHFPASASSWSLQHRTEQSRRAADVIVENAAMQSVIHRVFILDREVGKAVGSLEEGLLCLSRQIAYWNCSRPEAGGEASCQSLGGCHRRCWWRDLAPVSVRVSSSPTISTQLCVEFLERRGVACSPQHYNLIASIVQLPGNKFYTGVAEKTRAVDQVQVPQLSPVSRAFLKLEEVFVRWNQPLPASIMALDAGSAPGGWSKWLVEHRARTVIAVDPAEMLYRPENERGEGEDGGESVSFRHMKMTLQESIPVLQREGFRFNLFVSDMYLSPKMSAVDVFNEVNDDDDWEEEDEEDVKEMRQTEVVVL